MPITGGIGLSTFGSLKRAVRFAVRQAVGTITRVVTDDPLVALSFDDGPDPAFTPRLLAVLERHNARGTFFMVGQAAAQQPALVRRLAEAGHAIGNHTWDHPSMPLVASAERRRQLRACERALGPHGHKLYRPPYGHHNLAAHLDALRLGYRVVAWDCPAGDWYDLPAEAMLEQITHRLRPGSICLFHDRLHTFQHARYTNREPTLRVVESLLRQYAGKYEFVTIPELLRHGRPQRRLRQQPVDLDFLNRLQTAHAPARRYMAGPEPSRLEALLSRMGTWV
jgi:peptidoglycan/xylan/chitin deacetylase (PgdA/CDA1 family)